MPELKNKNKVSSYTKRTLVSVPAPIEIDSDSDFNPGEYVYESKKKKQASNGVKSARTSTSGSKRGRKRHIDDISYSGDEVVKPKRGSLARETQGTNPLLNFFGDDLGLHSASEDDEEDAGEEQDLDQDSDVEPQEPDEEPVVLKTMEILRKATSAAQPKASKPVPEDDSATESESEPEEIPRPVASKTPVKRPPPDDDSATESDSEAEPFVAAPRPKKPTPPPRPKRTPSVHSDSATESDSEPEPIITANPRLYPRPEIELSAGQTLLGPLVLDGAKGIVVPAAINTYLRDYQRDGVRFFWERYKEGRGGLLGDDMGLVSKTIQVISFLSAIMRKDGVVTDQDRRRNHVSKLQDLDAWKKRRELPPADATWPTCLIIAPSTVVLNWERELEKWGYFEVGLYTGTSKEREPVLSDFKKGRLDVVLTTFDLARNNIDILDSLPWTCVFVDEVHRVKKKSAKITIALNQFVCNRRFGLTGTTIQNSYDEMWAILDWTNPGRLGTAKQWKGYVVKPLTKGQSAGASEEERAKSLAVAVVLKNKLLPLFFLRRTKDIIKDQLPDKTDQVVFCPLTPIQISVYKNVLDIDAVQDLIHKDGPCFCGSGKIRKACCRPFDAKDMLRYISVLIKVSNHLALILPGPTDTADQTARNRVLADLAFPDGDSPKYAMAKLSGQYCGKWSALELLLAEWRKDPTNKVLIFTKAKKLIEMLEYHLQAEGYGFLKLDGETKTKDRMPMIDKFHEDPDVFIFLISTLAGGTGLNLTGANKVVIFDPNWNPAHDLQAMDRAFRFGQTRDVSVYRLLGAGSIEELIYARQLYKQQQMAIGYDASIQTRYFQGIQGDTAHQGELFGIKNLFKLHENTSTTKIAIEKASLAELDWALANMDAPKGKKNGKDHVDFAEAEAAIKDDINMRGLGSLLLDDDLPSVKLREQDNIEKILSSVGVAYSHRNDEMLIPSRIEEERVKTMLKTRRKRVRKSGVEASPQGSKSPPKPKPQWPPVRRHHKPLPTPEEQLASRREALVALGFIEFPTDVPKFAIEFARETPEARRAILAELDGYAKNQKNVRDSD